MTTEIEVKFINVDFDDIRTKLTGLEAECEQPMRAMRRAVFATDTMNEERNAYIRVRDEGHRTTVTYKQFDDLTLTGAKEIEVQVSDFEAMVAIMEKTGIHKRAYQESNRETWKLDGVEVVLDEWPWLNPYIEIEGPTEAGVQAVAEKLGLDWNDAVFGAVTQVYEAQYPNTDAAEVIMLEEIKFGQPLPEILKTKSV
jgi:adenylate cyclase, class 2